MEPKSDLAILRSISNSTLALPDSQSPANIVEWDTLWSIIIDCWISGIMYHHINEQSYEWPLSKDFMSVDLPSRLWYSNTALVVQFYINLFVIWIFVRNNCLLVWTSQEVAIGKDPCSFSCRLVIGEGSFVDSTVGELPASFHKFVVSPLSN